MLAFSIEVKGVKELQGTLRKASAIVAEELERATEDALTLVWREIQDVTTPVVTGYLRRSVILGETEVSETGVLGVVGTATNYAIPVELGVEPRPSRDKRSPGEMTKGFEGRRMFERGLEINEDAVRLEFESAAARIADRLTP